MPVLGWRLTGCALRRSSFLQWPLRFSLIRWERRAAAKAVNSQRRYQELALPPARLVSAYLLIQPLVAPFDFRGCHILESRTLSGRGSQKEIQPHVESQDETHQGKKEGAEKLCRRSTSRSAASGVTAEQRSTPTGRSSPTLSWWAPRKRSTKKALTASATKNLGSKLAPNRSKHSGCGASSLTKRNTRRCSRQPSRRARRWRRRPRDTSPISKLGD
jgi:hypothetical protein